MPEESDYEATFRGEYSELHKDIHNNLAVPLYQKWCKDNGYGDIIGSDSRMDMQKAIDSMNEFNESNRHLVHKHGDKWISFRFIDMFDISYEAYSDEELGQQHKSLKDTVESLTISNKQHEKTRTVLISILAIAVLALILYLI